MESRKLCRKSSLPLLLPDIGPCCFGTPSPRIKPDPDPTLLDQSDESGPTKWLCGAFRREQMSSQIFSDTVTQMTATLIISKSENIQMTTPRMIFPLASDVVNLRQRIVSYMIPHCDSPNSIIWMSSILKFCLSSVKSVTI